ncbi:MAG: hypothetical protein Aurels2KO_52830 [Aureliella sp.]
MLAGLPALLPGALLGRLGGSNLQDIYWLVYLLSAVELLAGLWLIKLGRRRAIAYMLFALQMSLIGSLGLLQVLLA